MKLLGKVNLTGQTWSYIDEAFIQFFTYTYFVSIALVTVLVYFAGLSGHLTRSLRNDHHRFIKHCKVADTWKFFIDNIKMVVPLSLFVGDSPVIYISGTKFWMFKTLIKLFRSCWFTMMGKTHTVNKCKQTKRLCLKYLHDFIKCALQLVLQNKDHHVTIVAKFLDLNTLSCHLHCQMINE